MNTADFLFPRDLQVTPTEIKKILIIGSCLSEIYTIRLREKWPGALIDYVLFNNASTLPPRTAEELGEYDLQYIQIPLRSVLTDGVVRIEGGDSGGSPVDWLDIGKQNITLMLEKALAYASQESMFTFVSNFIVPQGRIAASLDDYESDRDLVRVIRDLNTHLAGELKRYPHAYLADVDMIANSLGKRFFLDDIIFFYTHGAVFYPDWARHEQFPAWTAPAPGRLEPIPDVGATYENRNDEFFEAVFRQMEALYRTVKQQDMVKVVIFDLDNTMWRGQLVEHYQAGVERPYTDGWPLGIWEAVHHLRRRGIVVTIASKNDADLVVNKWDEAVDPPFIKYTDFLAPQINWDPKAENIRILLEKLSLTPRSALFVDDNPVERESVKALLPGIRAIGSDPFVVRRILLWSPEMQIAKRTEESVRREDMIKKQFAREQEKKGMSRDEFLRGLGSKVTITVLSHMEHQMFTRVFELVNKTNQFNTTGERWTLDDYRRHFARAGKVFVFAVSDRFTDYGTVGVAFVLGGAILQFVMSCRVLGMEIEVAALAKFVTMIRGDGHRGKIVASIKITESNTPCRDVFTRAGFIKIDEYTFILDESSVGASIDHVEIECS
ncbi:MAG TPA: HAD-IIIC family phosphatase [Steroidobacteraceae bacterium]|nr:HAD-IIIC family phosphatase [Steroidobacteraceae bacterium]